MFHYVYYLQTQQKHGNAHIQINRSHVACFTLRHSIEWDKDEVHIIGHGKW